MTTKFTPYIKSNVKTPEFTVRAVILGVVLGLIFASAFYFRAAPLDFPYFLTLLAGWNFGCFIHDSDA